MKRKSKNIVNHKITESDNLGMNSSKLVRNPYNNIPSIYEFNDSNIMANLISDGSLSSRFYDLDRLLEKDKLREKDGFPRKIRLGKLVKPSKDGKDKTIIIPSATEEKLYHWNSKPSFGEGNPTGGTGDGEEGEVIGEESLRPEGEGEGQGAGQGKSGSHGMGADAYDIGRVLTEQFELPNIKDKGKKTALTKFTYELTDKNRGHGQILDKKSTLKSVIKTNLALGRLSAKSLDTQKMIITPRDRVYRILSKEKDYESQAIVFFIRDYSGSMYGKPTEAVVTQHIYINSWLIFQYDRRVKSRFIVHDTEAQEVPDLYTYYNKNVAGGTEVGSAFKLANKIVSEENLARDFNIYIFYGTDGDDWDRNGKETLEQLKIMTTYANRIGITIAENNYVNPGKSIVETYLRNSEIIKSNSEIIHIDSFKAAQVNEKRLVEGIKQLIS